MVTVGKDVLSFDRDTAKTYLIDLAYFQIAEKVAFFKGPLGFIAAYISKIILGFFFEYTSEGAHRLEVFLHSMMKEKKYRSVREQVKAKSKEIFSKEGRNLNEKEKKKLFKEYYPAARNALTL